MLIDDLTDAEQLQLFQDVFTEWAEATGNSLETQLAKQAASIALNLIAFGADTREALTADLHRSMEVISSASNDNIQSYS